METNKKKQKDIFNDYFIRMQIPISCSVCGSEDWFIGRLGPEYKVEGKRTITPICEFCGRIGTYDASVIGLV